MDKLIDTYKPKFRLVNFEILLQNTITEEKFNLFKSLKASRRKKIFVGPQRLHEVNSLFSANDQVVVPLINAFSEYANFLDQCKALCEDDVIFIICAGMNTKLLGKDLLSLNDNITCLDFGSSMDAIFVGGTREGQPSPAILKNLYKDLL